MDATNNIVSDVAKFIQEKTRLKISTIRSILVNGNVIKHAIEEPDSVIEIVSNEINKSLFYDDNAELTYEKGSSFYKLSNMASTYTFTNNFLDCTKSIYDKISLDSKIEEINARQLENVDSVTLFLKLPRSYKIPTPIGNYSPDWAIVINEDNKKYRIIFESKAVDYSQIEELRLKEINKIKYAKKYYSIFDDVKFDFGNNFIEQFQINKS